MTASTRIQRSARMDSLRPHDAVIVAYKRTAIGRARKGSFAEERPEDLAHAAVSAALGDVPQLAPYDLEDFYLGTGVPQGAQGDNLARRVAVLAGFDSLPGATISRFCASSLEAIAAAARAIQSGDGAAYLVGGVESTSSQPPVSVNQYPGWEVAAERADRVFESGAPWTDPRRVGQDPDIYISMGKTAEFVAGLTGTTREAQDEWAMWSQQRATHAQSSGYLSEEIVPYVRRDGQVIEVDDGPRPSTTRSGLAALSPAFHPSGTVTAGNSSPLNDGASAAVVMSARRAQELGITPLGRIVGTTSSALSPEIMGLAPADASEKLLSRLGLTVDDIDLVELNEAFAAQVVPVIRRLGLEPERVNPHGGAIALGHPFGATGVRLVGTLLHGLREADGHLGLATLCVGGGQGMAMVVERL